MQSTKLREEKQTRPFWETLDSPAREYFGLISLLKLVLRSRGTDPDVIDFIEKELAEISKQWGPTG